MAVTTEEMAAKLAEETMAVQEPAAVKRKADSESRQLFLTKF